MAQTENGVYEAVKEWRLYGKSKKILALLSICKNDYELEVLNKKIDEVIQQLESENEVSI